MQVFDRHSGLFDRKVNILIKSATGIIEEKTKSLTVRILQGVQPSPTGQQREKLLRLEITNDPNDPFFLHALEVSDRSFHRLKQDQHLLVDFNSFSVHLMELLDCCLKSQPLSRQLDESQATTSLPGPNLSSNGIDQGRTTLQDLELNDEAAGSSLHLSRHRPQGQLPQSYIAVLQLPDPESEDQCSVLSIIETNPFKQLTHLALKLVPGNDASIKTYLSERLLQTLQACDRLSGELQQAQKDLTKSREAERMSNEQLRHASQQRDSEIAAITVKHGQEMTFQKEQSMKTLEESQRNNQIDFQKMQQRYDSEISQLRQKAEANDVKLEKMIHNSHTQESLLNETRKLLEAAKADGESYLQELKQLRIENEKLDKLLLEKNKQINQSDLKIAVLEQKFADKNEVLDKTTALLQAAEQHRHEIEESLTMYKKNHKAVQSKLESSIAEIVKGNSIIEKMHGENRSLRSKLQVKAKIIKQQEQLLAGKQSSVADLNQKLETMRSQIVSAEDRNAVLKENLESANLKLEESNKLLSSNQQVISWLNKEINDAQVTRGPLASVYKATAAGNQDHLKKSNRLRT